MAAQTLCRCRVNGRAANQVANCSLRQRNRLPGPFESDISVQAMEQPLSSQSNSLTRRSLLAGAMALSAASTVMQGEPPPSGLKVAIFSKHLRFLEGENLADGAASVGFDGIDLAVRAGGHVDPATVAQDLPKLVSLIRARGLEVPMITTDIVDDTSPHAEDVLRAANSLGIHHYRWGGFKYNDAAPIAEQLDALKPRVAKLAALNKRYNACAMYHHAFGHWRGWRACLGHAYRSAGFRPEFGSNQLRHRPCHDRGRLRRMDRQLSRHGSSSQGHCCERFPLGERCEGRVEVRFQAARHGHGALRPVLRNGETAEVRRPSATALLSIH